MDGQRTRRHVLLFLGNLALGVLSVVVTFIGAVWTADNAPLLSLIILVAVPALGTLGWRFSLEERGREPYQAKQVAWQAFRILVAWETVAIVILGFFLFAAFSGMAPVPHAHKTAEVVALIVIPASTISAIWFTWVRSRRMRDLLWPLPGMAHRFSESPYTTLKL